jgi:hypothetical protein
MNPYDVILKPLLSEKVTSFARKQVPTRLL